jgi:hypothetical protein
MFIVPYLSIFTFIFSDDYQIYKMGSLAMEHQDQFDIWWHKYGEFYTTFGIDKEQFKTFPFSDGIKKGDLLIIQPIPYEEILIGDVLMVNVGKEAPIAHRVVKKFSENGAGFITTKGDINPLVIEWERRISAAQIVGKVIRVIPS